MTRSVSKSGGRLTPILKSRAHMAPHLIRKLSHSWNSSVQRSNKIAKKTPLGPEPDTTVAIASAARSPWGRVFWYPLWDVLIIGGGFSFLVGGLLYFSPQSFRTTLDDHLLWPALLLVNATHFAASYIRVYTKPKAMERLPTLSV